MAVTCNVVAFDTCWDWHWHLHDGRRMSDGDCNVDYCHSYSSVGCLKEEEGNVITILLLQCILHYKRLPRVFLHYYKD